MARPGKQERAVSIEQHYAHGKHAKQAAHRIDWARTFGRQDRVLLVEVQL